MPQSWFSPPGRHHYAAWGWKSRSQYLSQNPGRKGSQNSSSPEYWSHFPYDIKQWYLGLGWYIVFLLLLGNNILSTDPRRRVSTSVNTIAWVGSRTWWWLFDKENTYAQSFVGLTELWLRSSNYILTCRRRSCWSWRRRWVRVLGHRWVRWVTDGGEEGLGRFLQSSAD